MKDAAATITLCLIALAALVKIGGLVIAAFKGRPPVHSEPLP